MSWRSQTDLTPPGETKIPFSFRYYTLILPDLPNSPKPKCPVSGVHSKTKVRDGGIDGKLYPIEDIQKTKVEGMDLFGEIDRYIPIQVKRTDQVGRPDIENFEVAMKRDGRNKGIFVGFDFSRDAEKEIRRVERDEGLEIEAIKVSTILENQLNGQLK